MNDSAGVTDELARRVTAAISTLGFKPSYSGRFLRTKRSHTVYLLVPEIGNPYFTSIYDGVRIKMEEHGFMTFLFQPTDPERVTRSLAERGADGVILDSLYAEAATPILDQQSIPYVICNAPSQLGFRNAVSIDLYSSFYSLFDQMIRAGHTQIGIITYQLVKRHSFDRVHAYEQACKDHSIPFDRTMIAYQDITKSKYQCGHDGFRELRAAHPEITAIATVNDLIAIGAMNAARDMGVSVPHDVSIIGFDNDEVSQFTEPRLSTVNLPKEKQGELSADMLLRLMADPGSEQYSVQLQPEIILRESFRDRS